MPPHMPPVRARATAALAAAALAAGAALAGCGGGRTAHASDGRVTLTLDDFSIVPQDVSAPAGELTVTVVNRGRIGHNLHVRARTRDVVQISTLKPGGRVTRRFRLAPGKYTMYCSVANHEELGMYGTLVVR